MNDDLQILMRLGGAVYSTVGGWLFPAMWRAICFAWATNAKGVFVAYSTGPGQVAQDGFGKHSPFMEAILATMNDGRMPIYDFFKRVAKKVSILSSGSQTPWIEDCLTSTDVTLF